MLSFTVGMNSVCMDISWFEDRKKLLSRLLPTIAIFHTDPVTAGLRFTDIFLILLYDFNQLRSNFLQKVPFSGTFRKFSLFDVEFILHSPTVIPPKLIHDQIPDHRVLEFLVEINAVVDVGEEDVADDLFEFAAFVGVTVVAGHDAF